MLACCTTPARVTSANHAFLYDFSVKEEGILIDPTRLFLGGEPGERYALTVTVITNTGVSYEAPLTVSIPAEENSEKPAESSAQPEETVPAVAPGERNRIPLALDSSGCYHCRRSRSGSHGFDKAEKEISALKSHDPRLSRGLEKALEGHNTDNAPQGATNGSANCIADSWRAP